MHQGTLAPRTGLSPRSVASCWVVPSQTACQQQNPSFASLPCCEVMGFAALQGLEPGILPPSGWLSVPATSELYPEQFT